MPFRNHNAYYLRISAKNVLPLYLYLDDRHVEWMSDAVLQHVLADIKPLIVPKLKAEAAGSGGPFTAKQGTVDVHRGDSYQFAFFFRKTASHSVLIKSRQFTATLRNAIPHPKRRTLKRPLGTNELQVADEKVGIQKKRKTKGKEKATDRNDKLTVCSDENRGDGQATINRRSGRPETMLTGGYREESDEDVGMGMVTEKQLTLRMNPPTPTPMVHDMGLNNEIVVIKDEDDDIQCNPLSRRAEGSLDVERPPVLRVDTDDEEMEPWPAVRFASRAPSAAPVGQGVSRAQSIAPPDFVPSAGKSRVKTPLFLPDFDRGDIPDLSPRQTTLPLFEKDPDGQDDDGARLMEFSHVLNSAGNFRAGAEDDDEIDGAVFFGDADEVREF